MSNTAVAYKTFDELNNAHPCRGEMPYEEEVAYAEAAFGLYEAGGFSEAFSSPYEEMQKYNGMAFTVDGRVTTEDADPVCLPMWHITFENGDKHDAYPEEICRNEA